MGKEFWKRKAPWLMPPLDEWSICGMNHYHVSGEKFLFVAMTKDDKCIISEGRDDKYLWNRLWNEANLLEALETKKAQS